MTTSRLFPVLIWIALVLTLSPPAFAHKATVFAWLEGDTILTESRLSGGKTVTHGEITVFNGQGTKLLSGTTDTKGNFAFKNPHQGTLKIVLDAGMGHRAEWLLSRDDLSQEKPPTTESEVSQSGTPREVSAPSSYLSPTPTPELEQMLDRMLDKKLQPIHKLLIEAQMDKPSINDILGGIGYIIGLVGLATYVQNRRKT